MSKLEKPFPIKNQKNFFKTENLYQDAACEEKTTNWKKIWFKKKKLGLE